MSRAPANLLAVRTLLLQHLNIKPTNESSDLEPAEVGIVGDPNHRGGYHCGSDRLDADDYSVRESSRDKAGLTLDAAALDVGWFEVRSGGAVHNMRTFAVWCVNQCRANTPDSRDIREIIYSPDGKVVRRWDRLGKRTTGDITHLSHDHFSFFRDATKSGRDQRPLFRRYLTEIGLLEGDDMDQSEKLLHKIPGDDRADVGWALSDVSQAVATLFRPPTDPKVVQGLKPDPASVLGRLLTAADRPAATLTEADRVDIAAKVVAGLPSDLAAKVADELHARLEK